MDILFLSPADWEGVRGRFQHLALQLARHNRVLYADSIGLRPMALTGDDARRIWRRLVKGFSGARAESAATHDDAIVEHISPLVLPFRRRPLVTAINRGMLLGYLRRQMRRRGYRDPLIWIAYPHPDLVAILDQLSSGPVIYDCVDAWGEFRGLHEGLGESEIELIRRADTVLATAKVLQQRASRYNERSFLVPNGVDIAGYNEILARTPKPPADLAAIPSPRIGFVGNIAQWVDVPLVEEIARRRPSWQFVLIGPWQRAESSASLANLHWLGPRSYRDVPAYITGFDVSIIPFAIDALTEAVDPLKLYEYLAAGSAVVATPLPAVSPDLAAEVRWARSAAEFESAIDDALKEQPPRDELRRALASRHSWEQRMSLVADVVQRQIGLSLMGNGSPTQ